jgi:hypothetical protein
MARSGRVDSALLSQQGWHAGSGKPIKYAVNLVEQIDAARSTSDPERLHSMAIDLHMVGEILVKVEWYEAARAAFAEAAQCNRQQADREALARNLHWLGNVLHEKGRPAEELVVAIEEMTTLPPYTRERASA